MIVYMASAIHAGIRGDTAVATHSLKTLCPHGNKAKSVLPNRCAPRANLTVLSPRSRCILERHLAEDYAVTDFLFAHNLSRAHYPKKCTRAHAGLQSQSEEMELDDRLAKMVSLEAYTIKSP